MKKYNLLILVLLSIVFTNCKPDNEQSELILTVSASMNNSKTSFDIADKIIRWEEDDVIFGKGVESYNPYNIIRKFTLTELSNDKTQAIFQYSTYQEPVAPGTEVVLPPSECKELYTLRPTKYGASPLSRIDLDLSSQTGNIEDFGKYHVGKANIEFVGEISGNDHHYKTNANFTSVTSLTRFDFSCFNLDDNITIKYNNSRYIFRYTSDKTEYLNANNYGEYPTPQDPTPPTHTFNHITITSPSADSYVTFLVPEEGTETNLEVTFEDEHGTSATLIFPNGIKQNRLYTAKGNPIKIIPGAKIAIE